MKIIALVLCVAVMMLAACQAPSPTGGAVVNITIINISDDAQPDDGIMSTPDDGKPIMDVTPDGVVITAVEGELISLKPKAEDPDGDKVTYTFSKPFNKDGTWQTKDGDVGKYVIDVTASDGKATASQEVNVVVLASNKAPIVDCPARVEVKEGQSFSLDCVIVDKEGDDIVKEVSGWMSGFTKQVGYDDAGTHVVHIKASDGSRTAETDVTVVVADTNRAPVIERIANIDAKETDTVKLNPTVSDPDSDTVTVTYSEPFDKMGVFKTVDGDAGIYDVKVTASDGKLQSSTTFRLTVEEINTKPVLKRIADITVDEGDVIRIPIDAFDPEGDALKVRVSGWMTSDTYTTTYNDAGTHAVKVTVGDGEFEVSQDFNVIVKDVNRPPVFRIPA
ncbi:MAG: hypothetical protein ABIH41_05860 [Nanoarchaeota archaeon]